MATINPSNEFTSKGVVLTTWTLLASGDVGLPLTAANLSDKTVQVTGPTGGTTNVVIEGSNDDVTYTTLTNPNNDNLDFTAEALETILENPRYIRPRLNTVTSGAASPVIYIVSKAHG